MTEREPGRAELVNSESQLVLKLLEDLGTLEPEELAIVFQTLISQQETKAEVGGGKKPTRVRKIWEAFKNRPSEAISLTELATLFPESAKDRTAVATAVARINNALEAKGTDLEIRSEKVFYLARKSQK